MIFVRALAGTTFGTKCPIFGTKLHGEGTKKAACFFVRVCLCMTVRDFQLVGTVSNNEEYSIIFTNLHKLDKFVLMGYSALQLAGGRLGVPCTRIRSLDRAIPILGLTCQFSLIVVTA